MLRRFILPLLGIALFATEAASAQTTPIAQPVAGAYNHPVARPKALTAREKRAAEAAAKAEALAAAKQAAAQPSASAGTSWNNEPLPATSGASYRPATNLSVAPGMPLNQVGHGVTTDYNGRPLHHEVASTTIPAAR